MNSGDAMRARYRGMACSCGRSSASAHPATSVSDTPQKVEAMPSRASGGVMT